MFELLEHFRPCQAGINDAGRKPMAADREEADHTGGARVFMVDPLQLIQGLRQVDQHPPPQ